MTQRRFDPRAGGHRYGQPVGHSADGRAVSSPPAFGEGHPDSGAEPAEDHTYSTGTTVVALQAADAVVMAADQRMSLGGRFTANKNARKLTQVHPRGVMAISGSVGPAQAVARSLRAEADLYEVERGEPMSMTALSRTAGALLRGQPVVPLLGGVDDDGAHVYELDGGGSVMEDVYAAGGSGMQVAYGVLERRFERGASPSTAREAAVDAVTAASERDTASGNGVHVATITAVGVDVEAIDSGDSSGVAAAGGGA